MCVLNRVRKQDCCGCGACVNICPKQILELKEDKEGFLQVKLSQNNCIQCGICEKVCPVLNSPKETEREITAFAVKNTNQTQRLQSSSGGVFTALAHKTLEEGGVVCAARFDKDFSVIHDICQTKEELSQYIGSKYVQSDLKDCFKKIKTYLNNNTQLLFVGTPCQVMALKLYLKKEYQNLIAVEIVCHGVSSPLAWRKYLSDVCKRKNITLDDIKHISFRNKEKSWRVFNLKIEGKTKTILKENLYDNPFLRGFLRNLFLRQSCHHCPAKNFKSNADLSLADYWGIDRFHPEMDDNKGVSAVLCYNDKITLDKNEIKQRNNEMILEIKSTNLENILRNNSALLHCVAPHKDREQFFEALQTQDITPLLNKYVGEPKAEKLKRKTRFILSDIKSMIIKKGGF
jgi:coenzyme F420-reducing hydrogenase beta subunit